MSLLEYQHLRNFWDNAAEEHRSWRSVDARHRLRVAPGAVLVAEGHIARLPLRREPRKGVLYAAVLGLPPARLRLHHNLM